jgi:Methyltransferase domain
MGYFLNTTDEYYVHDKNSLGWELTVCNALYPEVSPCRNALQIDNSFGRQLFYFLRKFIPLDNIKNVMEVGGGFGYLMQDFLNLAPQMKVTMLDISPYLLEKQKETLSGHNINFLQHDILTMQLDDLRLFDFVILNENLGDFPTLVAGKQSPDGYNSQTNYYLNKVITFNGKYNLKFDQDENINIGALEVLDNLCLAGVKYIYLSEHSCEATPPDSVKSYINFESASMPERIALRKHDEYTIKFSHLQQLAKAHHYKTVRGQLVDFLPLNCTDRVRTALRSHTPFSDEQEIIQQFVYDLYKYEYMVIIKQ